MASKFENKDVTNRLYLLYCDSVFLRVLTRSTVSKQFRYGWLSSRSVRNSLHEHISIVINLAWFASTCSKVAMTGKRMWMYRLQKRKLIKLGASGFWSMDRVRSEAEHGYISLCHNGLQRCQTEFGSQDFMFPRHEMRFAWVWSVTMPTMQATWHDPEASSIQQWNLFEFFESSSFALNPNRPGIPTARVMVPRVRKTRSVLSDSSKCLNLAPFCLLFWTWKANFMACILPSGLGLWSSNLPIYSRWSQPRQRLDSPNSASKYGKSTLTL